MTYLIPTNLEAALISLAQQHDRIVAGGTDVYPAMKQGHTPRSLLDVTRIKELMNITVTDTGLRIGAAVTWTKLLKRNCLLLLMV